MGGPEKPSGNDQKLDGRRSIESEIAAAGIPMSKEDEDMFNQKVQNVLDLNEQSEVSQISNQDREHLYQ